MSLGADLVSRGHRYRPLAPLVRATMRTQAAVLRAAGSTFLAEHSGSR